MPSAIFLCKHENSTVYCSSVETNSRNSCKELRRCPVIPKGPWSKYRYSSIIANGLEHMAFNCTMWPLDKLFKIVASLRNKRFSYWFYRSNFFITTTSPQHLMVKTAPKLPCPIPSLSQSSSHLNCGSPLQIDPSVGCLPTKTGSFWAPHATWKKPRAP